MCGRIHKINPMSEEFKNPNEIKPSKNGKSIIQNVKFNFAGTLSAVVRTIIDIYKPVPSWGVSTMTEWIKAIKFKSDMEREAYMLLTRSLIKACRVQLKSRIDDINQNEDGVFIYMDREIGFVTGDINEGIDENDYILDLNQFDNPGSFSLLADFKPFYKDWILESFPISESCANELAADFSDYFAYQFQLELCKHPSHYPEILKAHSNPFNEKIAQTLERHRYRLELKSKYNQPALGEHNIALSDVYIQPDFWIYDAIFPKEKRAKLKEKSKSGVDHFLSTNFKGSLHDYLLNHFLKSKQSKAIGQTVEASRMLILMGQPGHGKSSFCYRSINDLLRNSDFHGNAFFVRLQEAERDILNIPLTGMAETKSIKEYNIGFKELIEDNNGQPNVIFLDGLDEFFMTKSLSDGDVLQFLNNCKNLLGKNKDLYLIITSRFNYVETSKLYNDDCLLFSLGTLSEKQQGELVSNYKKRMEGDGSCYFSPQLLKKINKEKRLKHIKELIELPILLQMILISGINIDSVGSRARVYNELFTTVLDRKWDKDRRLKKYKDAGKFEKEHLRRYLAFLAYKIFQYNKGYLNKSEVTNFDETKHFITKRLRIESEKGELKDVLKDILTSFYLKESPKNKTDTVRGDESHDYAIEFLHKSLYEYLACEHLWNVNKNFFLERSSEEPEECKEHALEDVQRKIQGLFAHTNMTSETMDYMAEIINRNIEDHELLSERMGHYLPRLLKNGFLFDYNAKRNLGQQFFTAENQTMNIFHNYGLILGNLNLFKVEKERFLASDWGSLKKDTLFVESKDDMTKNYGKNVLQDELKDFTDFIYDRYEGARAVQFQNWVRGYLLRKNGMTQMATRNNGILKEHEAFVRQLRLLGSERKPMKLNLSYVPLERADLYGLVSGSINLFGAYLRSADLRSADLRSADLSSADLRSADLSSADLRSADLRSADLRSADLRSAYLRSADLRSADLRSAYLRSADLRSADLRSADLRSADLSSAYLSSADLRSADLSGADLSGADLSGADLRNTYLSGADLRNTYLSSADLRNAKLNLAKVDSPKWLDLLKEWDIKGVDWVLDNYTNSKEKKSFSDRYGLVYEAYEILLKGG